MKILYGVQATGNGHITRARAISQYFSEFGIEVDYLFSGRSRDQFWDMEIFGDWRCHRGFTFQFVAGKLNTWKTIANNSVTTFLRDVRALELDPYDLVLTDFEPITAIAARRAKKMAIGIGHQYAFEHKAPRRGDAFVPSLIMKNFAPVKVSLGLHWHHFDSPILPPIAEVHHSDSALIENQIIVYLGFEDPQHVIDYLAPFSDFQFLYYGPFERAEQRGHIQLKPLSRDAFKQDLAASAGVICNAGFELGSEAIQLGKKLLVKPLQGQMEQLSNALALEKLGLGMSMDTLDRTVLEQWLSDWQGKKVVYPNVARSIVQWISQGEWMDEGKRLAMIEALWQQTDGSGVSAFEDSRLPALVPATV